MLAPVLLALGLALPPGGGAKAQIADNLLSHDDRAHYRKAYRAAKKRNWPGAHRLARRAKDPLPAKALRWLNYRESGNRASFNEITDFLTTNPAWPSRQRLIRRAEEAMEKSRVSDRAALDWFTLHRPLSGPGQIRLAEAMLANGMQEDGMQWLRYAWINNVFARRQSKKLYRRYRKTFTMADHIARLDHLLWQGHRYSARRLYTVVPKDYRKLAEARESLMVRGPGVDSKIRAVPANLLSDGGVNYERVRWRRRKNLDKTAREILLKPRPHLGPRPEKWWLERHIQARGALREGDAALAYRLAANHGQVPGRFSFAQAEWLAGWIALRFLNDGAQSLRHFAALYNNVRFPVSLARAAYWAGRANIALSRSIDATKWYRAAARYPSTYYGQLAIQALGPKAVWRMPREPSPRDAVMRKFNNREIVRLSRIFLELGQEEHLRPFILHLTRSAVDADGRLLAARLGQALGQPSLAVHAAKLSLRAGTLLPRTGYPILSKMPPMPVEAALAHAVARQESEFNPRAVSSASAMGLMQLLPRTARKVAKGLHLRYRQDRLFDGGYNMRLGAAYLGQLVKAYRGSYIMALAAYNAGPNRVSRWRRKNGDPRKDGVDPIDWVEAISISETRNYVQRVLENLQVYRWRLHPKGAKLTLLEDLHRNGTPSQ
ncbi:MAG: lytic transglycosylase domain-containing protein [Rhodospirillaceae bacterium]|nr:lytic transglycosylase domain-containing protein [Rhodospirillaceae bacterium]